MNRNSDSLHKAVENFYTGRDSPFKDAEEDAVLDVDTQTETGYESHVIKAGLHLRKLVDEDVAERHYTAAIDQAISQLQLARNVAEREGATGARNTFAQDVERLQEIRANITR